MKLSTLVKEVQGLSDAQFLEKYLYPFLLEEGEPGAAREERLVFPLAPPVTRIGRGAGNQARVCQAPVSSEHAELHFATARNGRPGTWRLVDLGSTNGTFLDSVRVGPGAPIRVTDESVIGLGPIRFAFLVPRSLLVILRRFEVQSAEFKLPRGEEEGGEHRGTISRTMSNSGISMGTLEGRSLIELLEEIESNQRTGSLGILEAQGAFAGRISFRAGHLCDATTKAGDSGIQAVKALLKLERGSFVQDGKPPEGTRRISTSFSEILRGAEHKRSKRALALSEAQLWATLENAFHGIISCSGEGEILSLNTKAKQLFGYCPEDAAQSLETILRCESGEPVADRLLCEQGSHNVHELTGLGKNDVTFPIEVAVTRVEVEGRCTWSLAVQDLTAHKQAEKALRDAQAALQQSQKMDAIGQLAAGIAHDFNNLLSVINGYSDLLVDSLSEEDPQRKRAQRILGAGQRASELTKKLLAFCRRQELTPQPTDLNEVIAGLGELLGRLIGGIELKVLPGASLAKVLVDKGQIEQVLMNLVVNARDASPDGGRILVATANVLVNQSSRSRLPGLPPGPYVRMTVTDNGLGMSAETAARIFEPFFTTKPKGKGTGLGLATVYGIVKQSKGHITVESEEGTGTTFAVYLPRLAAVPQPKRATCTVADAPKRKGQQSTAKMRHETILLAEDQEEIREFVREILSSKGYTIVEAVDGQQALDLFEEHPGRFDILLTDVVMPRLDGTQLAVRVRQLKQDLKVLFISAHVNGDGLVGESFLPKPFTPRQLSYSVRQMLDSISE